MVARGAGAAGPVLLAGHQWDPLGLARRLPSLGAGAWRSAPLLPWRVQFPVRVCAALAAGSGGSGRYLVLCPSRFPLPAPRVPRCVWRAVPSGCPLPSLAGTPFHTVCAFREIGPVALLVVPACPLRVCALALPRRPLPPPLGGVACAPCFNGSSDSTQIIHQCDQNFNDSLMYISAVNFPLVYMFSVRRQMSPVSARRVAFVFRDFPIGFI